MFEYCSDSKLAAFVLDDVDLSFILNPILRLEKTRDGKKTASYVNLNEFLNKVNEVFTGNTAVLNAFSVLKKSELATYLLLNYGIRVTEG